MKDAVIFSGGGGRGIFQVGAYLALTTHQDFSPTYFGGSSVGAFNASFFAAGKDDILTKAWASVQDNPTLFFPSNFINNKSQFRLTGKGLGQIIQHFATKKKIGGLVNPDIKEILESLTLNDLGLNELVLNAVSLNSGEVFNIKASQFPNNKEFRKMILASASFPGLFPVVDHVKTYGQLFTSVLDSGIREVTTLRQAVKDLRDTPDVRITIINCSTSYPLPRSDSYQSIENVIGRSIDIIRHTVFRQEIALFKERNQIGAPLYRRFTYRVIEPDPARQISPMDFSKTSQQDFYQHGKEQALTSEWIDV